MRNFSKQLLGAAALALGLIGAPAAQGASVTFSNTFGGLTDVSNQAITLDQFNPALGTLLSATFTLSAQMSTIAYATNDGDFLSVGTNCNTTFSWSATAAITASPFRTACRQPASWAAELRTELSQAPPNMPVSSARPTGA